MDKDLNLRRLNPFKPDINIVRHNFKNQSQQTDLRKHFPGETQTPDSFRIRWIQSLPQAHERPHYQNALTFYQNDPTFNLNAPTFFPK